MESLKQEISLELFHKYSCSQAGINGHNEWDVRGFYDDKFDDPMNFNLSENTVSLISASAISFSLILFIDIVFRVFVRARIGRVSRQVVLRRLVLENFANPINLLSMVMRRIRVTCFASSEDSPVQEHDRSPGLSRYMHGTLVLMGMFTIFTEFLFILLATNQNKAYRLQLEAVPIFEIEDRGCEFINAPAAINACDQSPLTQKAGFDSRGAVQICTTSVDYSSRESSTLSESHQYFLLFSVLNGDHVQATVMDKETTSFESTRMGVLLDQSGRFYTGMQNVTSEHLLSALSTRMKRANITIITSSPIGKFPRPGKPLVIAQQTILTNVRQRRQRMNVVGASVLVNASTVDLRQTHLSFALVGDNTKEGIQELMHTYFLDVMRSLMFPTGKGRGRATVADEIVYLDQDPTPLAYYNRPWIGVLPSLYICYALLLVWIVLAALGIESGIDSRLALNEIFKNTDTTRIPNVQAEKDSEEPY